MRIPALTEAAPILSLFSIFQKPLNNDDTRNDISESLISHPRELPGGSPFSLCKESSSTDFFNISSVEVTHQPIYINDVFLIHIYGTFQSTFKSNATIDLTVDCGSHCDMYGAPPDQRAGETLPLDFCELAEIEQPTGGKKRNDTCHPQPGYALITSEAYIFPMAIRAPGWYNFTIDVNTAEGDRVLCMTTEVCLRWEDEERNKHYPKGPWTNCTWPR